MLPLTITFIASSFGHLGTVIWIVICGLTIGLIVAVPFLGRQRSGYLLATIAVLIGFALLGLYRLIGQSPDANLMRNTSLGGACVSFLIGTYCVYRGRKKPIPPRVSTDSTA